MEKIIGLALALVYSVWFFTGQTSAMVTEYSSIDKPQLMHEDIGEVSTSHTQKEMHHIIKVAAEKEGWVTTEFKSNTLIAEKLGENDSISVTVTFDKYSFNILPENSDLKNTLDTALNL